MIQCVQGHLLEQDVEVIVNPWHLNLLPWWFPLHLGVGRDIIRAAGIQPYRELAKYGVVGQGSAMLTGSGKLRQFSGIIHVALYNETARTDAKALSACVANAMHTLRHAGYHSVAFPLLGTELGILDPATAENLITSEVISYNPEENVLIVSPKPSSPSLPGRRP